MEKLCNTWPLLPVITNKIIIIKSLRSDHRSGLPAGTEVCKAVKYICRVLSEPHMVPVPLSPDSLLNSADAKGLACSPFDFFHKVLSLDVHLARMGKEGGMSISDSTAPKCPLLPLVIRLGSAGSRNAGKGRQKVDSASWGSQRHRV